MTPHTTGPPVLRVLRGHPTEAEVAALVTVLAAATAAAGAPDPAPAPTASAWATHDRLVRAPHHPRPGGWRASAIPS